MPSRKHSEPRAAGIEGGRRSRTGSPPGRPVPTDFGRRAAVLNVAFWTFFGLYQASNRLLSPVGDRFPHPERLIAIAMLTAYLWALLTPPIFRLAAWVIAGHDVRLARVALAIALGFLVAILASLATGATHRLLLPRLRPGGMAPGPPPLMAWGLEWAWSQRRWFSREAVTFCVVFVAGVVNHMSRRYRAREREAADLQAEASRLEAEQAELRARTAQLQAQGAELHAQLAEARLATLRARLNPHFLFNTLNAVSALVAKDPRGVRDMIALLSELLRHALADSREQEIPLREELRLMRLYLEILEIRYQGQLRTAVNVDAGVQAALVPNLILQPLVENAMKHGIDRAGGHGAIEVLAHRHGDDLVLTVRDTGPGDPGAGDGARAPAGTSGVGLQLTRERLAELYGAEQRLELKPVSGGGMTARIVLPYHTAEDVRVAKDVSAP